MFDRTVGRAGATRSLPVSSDVELTHASALPRPVIMAVVSTSRSRVVVRAALTSAMRPINAKAKRGR